MSEKKEKRPSTNGIRCPKCGITSVRYRQSSDDFICNRCGTVFDRMGNVKQ